MHHGHGRAAGILRSNLRRIRQIGLLGDGQRIHVGPQHEHFAGTVLQHADDAVAADARRHLDTERPQLLRHAGGRFLFLER